MSFFNIFRRKKKKKVNELLVFEEFRLELRKEECDKLEDVAKFNEEDNINVIDLKLRLISIISIH